MSVAALKRINRACLDVKRRLDWAVRPNFKKQQFDDNLASHGFVVTDKREIRIDETVLINLPKSAFSSRYVGDNSQFDFYTEMQRNSQGVVDRRITNSMHVRFLRDHFERGRPYETTDYWALRKEYSRLGVSVKSDDQIRQRMDNFIELCLSIKKQGFKNGVYANNPFVLEKPYIETRHGIEYNPGGYEIWIGHHRLAVLAYLGYEKIETYFLKDLLARK